jgi:hypothetical protein
MKPKLSIAASIKRHYFDEYYDSGERACLLCDSDALSVKQKELDMIYNRAFEFKDGSKLTTNELEVIIED